MAAMSADWPEEGLITTTFEDYGGKTGLTLRHGPVPPGPERDMRRQGWNETLCKLEDYLAMVQAASQRSSA